MLLEHLIPRLYVDSIYDIDLEKLKRRGMKGIITDLDNTLVGTNHPAATPRLIDWLQQVRSLGLQVVIVSNNRRERVSRFAEPLSVPYIYKAKKPIRVSFQKALNIMGILPQETAVIGDQLLTDVLGGNRMGMYTILVAPVTPNEEKWTTRMNRRLEKIAFKWMKKKGLLSWKERS